MVVGAMNPNTEIPNLCRTIDLQIQFSIPMGTTNLVFKHLDQNNFTSVRWIWFYCTTFSTVCLFGKVPFGGIHPTVKTVGFLPIFSVIKSLFDSLIIPLSCHLFRKTKKHFGHNLSVFCAIKPLFS